MPEKLNVLAISYGRNLFDRNNPERQRMVRCGKEIAAYHMIVFTSQGDGLAKTTDGNLTLHPTNSRSRLHMLFDAYRIGKQMLKNHQGTWIVTAQDPFEAGLIGLCLARQFKVPLNVQEHGDFYSTPYWSRDRFLNRFRSVLGRFVLKRADTVRVVSRRIRRALMRLGVTEDRLLTLAVRTDNIAIDTQSATNTLRKKLPDASVIVLTMGRLVTQKNIPLIIKAFTKLQQQDQRAHLVIVGRGDQETRLKKLVAQLDMEKNVLFMPWTDTPQQLLREADIYTHGAYWEGWGRVFIEAMAAGVPVITTDVGCAGEVLKDEVHGFVVPVADEQRFATRLITLASDQGLRERFAAAAQLAVQETHLTFDDYASEWRRVFETTLELTKNKTGAV